MVQLGDKVKDLVTGIEGIATSRTEWLNGCIRIGIEFAANKKGDPPRVERETFDEEQLEVVKVGAVIPARLRVEKQPPRGTALGRQRTGGGGRPDPVPQR